MDLYTRYLDLDLRCPLVASASPLTGELDSLRRLQDAGAAAVVLPSVFEEQLNQEALEADRLLAPAGEHPAPAPAPPPGLDDYNRGPWAYLGLIEKARAVLAIPVIASLNGTTPGAWTRHARWLEEAGADALELNLYVVPADPSITAVELEARYLDLVADVRATVRVPLAVKLSPYLTAPANLAVRLVEAGADGLVLFNRFYQPDLDLDRRDVAPRLVLSTSEELRLPLRWIAILYGRVRASLAATSGVHTGHDAAKVLLAGADVAMLASALLQHGPEHLTTVERELVAVLTQRQLGSLDELRGSMSRDAVADPAAFERANYMRTLLSYSGPVSP